MARELAITTYGMLSTRGIPSTDYQSIVECFGVTLQYDILPADNPGCYIKDEQKIVLNSRISNVEWQNFTFCHELMHDRIERNDDFLNALADADTDSIDDLIERLCDIGAAEILMPLTTVQETLGYQFQTSAIPLLCERFGASPVAAAIRLVDCASHRCYLAVGNPELEYFDASTPLFPNGEVALKRKIRISYTGKSGIAKYAIGRNTIVPTPHLMYQTLSVEGDMLTGRDLVPFRSGKIWRMDCDALYYRGRVFCLFHEEAITGRKNQLALF